MRCVDAQDVGAEQREVAGGYRSGEDTGQVQDPYTGQRPFAHGRPGSRGGAVGHEPFDEGKPTGRPPVRMLGPVSTGADRPCNRTGGCRLVLQVDSRPPGNRCGDLVLRGIERDAEKVGKALGMVRIVPVRTDPAVGYLPEPGVRRPHLWCFAVELEMAFALRCGGDACAIDSDRAEGGQESAGDLDLRRGERGEPHAIPQDPCGVEGGGERDRRARWAYQVQCLRIAFEVGPCPSTDRGLHSLSRRAGSDARGAVVRASVAIIEPPRLRWSVLTLDDINRPHVAVQSATSGRPPGFQAHRESRQKADGEHFGLPDHTVAIPRQRGPAGISRRAQRAPSHGPGLGRPRR